MLPKKRIPVTEYYFNKLIKYPIPRDVTRSTKVRTNSFLIHDTIHTNLLSLVPNIDIGYQQNLDSNELISWIMKTKEYAEALNKDLQKKCDIKLEKVKKIEEQKEKSKVLNMELVNILPEDIIRYMYEFLLPETKIILFRARYPNLETNIMKLKVPVLKKLIECIRKNYYSPIFFTNNGRCLPKGFFMNFGFSNKKTCINNLNKLIGTYESAVAYSPGEYRYFQKLTLKIIRTLVYAAKMKKVLDKPYAPELEVKTEKPQQRKVRKSELLR